MLCTNREKACIMAAVIRMKFAFYTLGCKVNQYETQAMEQYIREQGHELGDWNAPCDCYVVNTCTVTGVSDKKCRAAIRRVRRDAPEAIVGVCGCYAQIKPEDARALGADVIAGTGSRIAFLGQMFAAYEDRKKRELPDDLASPREIERLPAGGLAARTRAMLKIEDGCDNFCAYCIIPYARGRVRSLPSDEVLAQARRCREEGYRELVVTGIELSSWGKDRPEEQALEAMLAALCDEEKDLRIRLGSLEPRTVTESFCKALSGKKNLCPQFHLSLQSGSDTVLRRMNRKYDTARFFESVRLLREAFPGCAITTDVIVGFPGETEEEFAETLSFLRRCGFAACHIFPYSRRTGTVAAKLPGQILNAVKQQRAAAAIAVAGELEDAYLAALTGSTQDVLFEQEEDGYFTGHAPNYAKVYLKESDLHNQIVPCRIERRFRDGVFADRA